MFEKIYYERRLPHWIPPGETLFLTYRLKNSLPVSTIKMLQDVLFKHREGGRSIVEIMKSHKGFTARQANKLLDRTGHAFWQEESYDHLVRSSHEEQRIVQYIINNPVKAGLVKTWKDWSWTYTSALSQ